MKRCIAVVITVILGVTVLCLAIATEKDDELKLKYANLNDFVSNLNWELTPKDLKEAGFKEVTSPEIQTTKTLGRTIFIDSFLGQTAYCEYSYLDDKLVNVSISPPVLDTDEARLTCAESLIKEMDSICRFTSHDTTDRQRLAQTAGMRFRSKRLNNEIDPMKFPREYSSKKIDDGHYRRYYTAKNGEFDNAVFTYSRVTTTVLDVEIWIIISNLKGDMDTRHLSEEE